MNGKIAYMDIGHDTPNSVLFYWSPKLGRHLWMATDLKSWDEGGEGHSGTVPREYGNACCRVSGRVCHTMRMVSIVAEAWSPAGARAVEKALGRIRVDLAHLFNGYEIRQFH